MFNEYIKNKTLFVSLCKKNINALPFVSGGGWNIEEITKSTIKPLPFRYRNSVIAVLDNLQQKNIEVVKKSDMPSDIQIYFNDFNIQLSDMLRSNEETTMTTTMVGTLFIKNAKRNVNVFLAGLSEIILNQWTLYSSKCTIFSMANIKFDLPLLRKNATINTSDNVPLYDILKNNELTVYNVLDVNDDFDNQDLHERYRNILQFMDVLFFDSNMNIVKTGNNIIDANDYTFIINCIEGHNRSVCYIICMLLANNDLLKIFDSTASDLPKNEQLWKHLIDKFKSIRGPNVWGSNNGDLEFILSYFCKNGCELSQIKRSNAINEIKIYLGINT